jgi:DNA-directed RNA polymerase specialized sigma24 family protein
LRKGLWETTTAALKTSGMKVSVRERSVLATYLLDAIAARDDMPDALLHAQSALDLQEAQMSFNLQYLQLQSQMQEENRSYASISAIMKTKHDTVKNSISNIR